MSFLISLVIAAIAGSLGARIAGRTKPQGCLTSIVLGFIGSLLGGWLARQLDLPLLWTPADFPVIWAIIGAALFVSLLNLISRR